MADTKISALTALAGADLAADDLLVVVDTSVTTTKSVRWDELNAGVAKESHTFTAAQVVVASAAAAVPLTVKGAASQSAKFLRVRNSSDEDVGGLYPVNSGAGAGLALHFNGSGTRGATLETDGSGFLNVATTITAGVKLDGVCVGGTFGVTSMHYAAKAYANDVVSNLQAGSIVVGRDVSGDFSVVHGTRFADVAPRKTIVTGDNACQSASTNVSGGHVYLLGGMKKAGGAGVDGHVYACFDGATNRGNFIVGGDNAAPPDASLAAGQMALWLDDTDGAAKLMIKAKQADGTVRTGEVALS